MTSVFTLILWYLNKNFLGIIRLRSTDYKVSDLDDVSTITAFYLLWYTILAVQISAELGKHK